MADTKITGLQTPQVTTNPATDVLPIVNIADNSMAASGSTRKITVNQLLGAGGTATLASATITGDLTVRTNKLKVDATGVAIGATSATYLLDVRGTDTTNALIAGTTKGIRFVASASTSSITGVDNTGAASYQPLSIGGSALDFSLSGSTAMTLNSTGLNIANGNVILGTSGKGIDFSAVTGGTGTATGNVLNDYEEGTWTIDLRFGGASVGITTNATVGRYTKIGRTVTVTGLLSLTSKGSSTGIAEIYGLPFTIANTDAAYSFAGVRFNGVSFADVPICIGAINSPKIILQEITNAGVVTDLTNADFSNTSQCIIGFTYNV